MVLSLLFGRKYAQTTIGNISLDATLSEDHSFTAKATQFPLENGSFVSDHVEVAPIRLNIRGIISDTPLNMLSDFNRSIDNFNRLTRLFETKAILSVITGIRVYQNMVMTSLNVPRDVETGQSLTFEIDLQEMRFVSQNLVYFQNQPFINNSNVIPRQNIADSKRYPDLSADADTSLKDQGSSSTDLGIQTLRDFGLTIKEKIQSSGLYQRIIEVGTVQ